VQAALGRLKCDARTAADYRLWAHYHPWLSVGAAAAGGYTAATFVLPRKRRRERDGAEGPADDQATDAAKKKAGWSGVLFGPLFKMLEGVLRTYVSAYLLHETAARPEPSETTGGAGEWPVSTSPTADSSEPTLGT